MAETLVQACWSVLADAKDSRRYLVLEGTHKHLERLAEACLGYLDHGCRRAIGILVSQAQVRAATVVRAHRDWFPSFPYPVGRNRRYRRESLWIERAVARYWVLRAESMEFGGTAS